MQNFFRRAQGRVTSPGPPWRDMDRSPRCPAGWRSMDPDHFDPGCVELRGNPEHLTFCCCLHAETWWSCLAK